MPKRNALNLSAEFDRTRLLTPAEAAEFLSISIRSVKRLVARDELPCVRVGGSMRFCFSDLLQYVRVRRSLDTLG